MKTNITNLMNLVAEDERKLGMLSSDLITHVYTTTAKELDGKINVIEDFKEDFETEFNEYNMLLERIAKYKKIIYLKNNELKLPSGISIQDALTEVNLLRRKYIMLERLAEYKNSNRRITEVNNSYFECKEINFNAKKVKEEKEKIQKNIQEIEFEISKLNSIEFDV